MADHSAILNTLGKWAYGYDTPDMTAMAECFTKDAELTMTIGGGDLIGPFSGIDNVMKLFTDSLEGQNDQRRHLTVNTYVADEDDTSATVRSVLTLLAIADGTLTVLSSGTYEDRVVRESDGEWRIAKRHIALDLPY
ncbi:MAG: nuclear transport factor 2 family protein [Actinomycetota bacterium]|nr:nuclear transport factor 2 family protein [Actinomycetota bacterium]